MLRNFPAKVLLLGEYTILNGSRALALPYPDLQGGWCFDHDDSVERNLSRASIEGFLENCPPGYLDLDAFRGDFHKGLWFKSTIPQGYGLGSSGALITAIHVRYGNHAGVDMDAKSILAKLEAHFHGSSSGIDPYVSLVQRPLLIRGFDDVEVLDEKINLSGFFLLNTGKPRQTGPLVATYREKLKDPEFKKGCADVLGRDVNLAIDALIAGDRASLWHHLWHISKFQWEFFPEMIPTQMRAPWSRGIESGEYVLKLCGAGGGGFLLGYSDKLSIQSLEEIFPDFEVRALGI